jgi:hypothetical protein
MNFPPNTILEGILVCGLAIWKTSSAVFLAITDHDWSRLLGPQGFTVGLIFAVVVLWSNGVLDRRAKEKREAAAQVKEDARREAEERAREKRHADLVTTNRDNAESLKALTVECVKAIGKNTNATEKMDRNIQLLTVELSERPCQITSGLKPIPGSMPNITRE